jgi:hypothetical protein
MLEAVPGGRDRGAAGPVCCRVSWSLRDVRSILDAHYLHRDPELARKAIRKLEMHNAVRRPEAEQVLQNSFDVLLGIKEKPL